MSSSSSTQNLGEIQRQVSRCYSTWGKTYFQEYYRSKLSYPPVHVQIVKNEIRRYGVQSVLDAGCGPASMLRQLRGLGRRRFGFDLTPGMVAEARQVLRRQGVPERNVWEGSVLDNASYHPPGVRKSGGFGAALCFGVLPHIPENSESRVFANLRRSVVRGGLVLAEARNEFFALFTCNRYSFRFLTNRLICPGEWGRGEKKSRKNPLNLIPQLKKHFRMDLPPIRRGKAGEPGYDEVLSRTHNPLVMARQFARAGFQEVEVLFYHYHCLPPMLEPRAPEVFRKQSLRMENPRDWRGYFMASAFILKGIAA